MTSRIERMPAPIIQAIVHYLPYEGMGVQGVSRYFSSVLNNEYWNFRARAIGVLEEGRPGPEGRRRIRGRLIIEKGWARELLAFAQITLLPGQSFPTFSEIVQEIRARKEMVFRRSDTGHYAAVDLIARIGFRNCLEMLLENMGTDFAAVPSHLCDFLRASIRIGNASGVADALSHTVTRALFDHPDFDSFLSTVVTEPVLDNRVEGMAILLSHEVMVTRILAMDLQQHALKEAAAHRAVGIVKLLLAHPTLSQRFDDNAYSEAFATAVKLQEWEIAELLLPALPHMTAPFLEKALEYGIEKKTAERVEAMFLSVPTPHSPLVRERLLFFFKRIGPTDHYAKLVQKYKESLVESSGSS